MTADEITERMLVENAKNIEKQRAGLAKDGLTIEEIEHVLSPLLAFERQMSGGSIYTQLTRDQNQR